MSQHRTFDGRQVVARDWIGVGAGALALVVSFLSWRHVSGPQVVDLARALGLKTWYTAWGSGVTGWLPVVLLVGAALLLLAPGFGIRVPGLPLLWLGMAFGALVVVVIRWVTLPSPDTALLAERNIRPEDVDTGASIGLYLGLAAAVISLLAALFRVLSGARPSQPATTGYAPPPTEQFG